jgi:hypothetical protein
MNKEQKALYSGVFLRIATMNGVAPFWISQWNIFSISPKIVIVGYVSLVPKKTRSLKSLQFVANPSVGW